VPAAGQTASYQYLHHPRPEIAANQGFGTAVVVLDFLGTGQADIAVSAPGEAAVYLFLAAFDHQESLRLSAPGFGDGDAYGIALAAGDLDGAAGDELVIGASLRAVDGKPQAGAVVVFGRDFVNDPKVIEPSAPEEDAGFGTSLEVADLDGDGERELAVGAPRAKTDLGPQGSTTGGKVYVLEWPSFSERVFANPNPGPNSNYGHDLAVGDLDRNGFPDLCVSALGNENSAGETDAGQVFALLGPISPMAAHARTVVFEDPDPFAETPINLRWGMSIDARGTTLTVGSPRKDWASEVDAGAGTIFSPAARTGLQVNPQPEYWGLMGYRARVVDLVGDATPDPVFVALGARKIFAFDGKALGVMTAIDGPPGTDDHWAQGIDYGQVVPGGKEELVLGSPHWEPSGEFADMNVGRAVIVEMP
jgi:hypothetical protein